MVAVAVVTVNELRPGTGRELCVRGRDYAVWLVGAGEARVLDGRCLHTGGPLAEGRLEDGCVVCPWHGWTYDLTTGRRRTAFGEAIGVRAYPAWVEDGIVWADLPE